MLPSAEQAFREVSRALDEYELLFGDPTVVCMGRARARDKLFRLHAKAKAELARPVEEVAQPFRAWTPEAPRNACPEYKPGAPA